MKKFTFRMLMLACFFMIAGHASAQLRIETNSQNGSEVTVDEDGAKHWVYHFNTTQTVSSVDNGLKSFRNRNGYQANVYDESDVAVNNGNRFNMTKYTSGANICHWESLASMDSVLSDPGGGRSTLLPSTGLFDVPGGGSAFGTTPGKYKKAEIAFYLKFVGYGITEDATFDIITYDEGMNLGGATASYDLSVYLGTDPNSNPGATPDANVPNFYVTGSGTKNVSLAAATGLNVSDFANQSIYVFLKTTGSGTAIADDVRDPMIVVDNIAAILLPPVWVDPAVAENEYGTNEKTPLVGVIGEENLLSIPLKTKGRLGSMTIKDDLRLNGFGDRFGSIDDKTQKPLTFLDTLAVMANDGDGNYTVEVPYSLEAATFDGEKWSNQKITIAAPTGGAVNDDLMFYFNATASEGKYSSRLEMDMGTRMWYDIAIAGATEWNISSSEFNALGTLGADTTVNGLSIYAAPDKNVTIDSNNKSIDGMDFTHRLKLGGSGRFVDGMPDARVLGFDVKGNTTITIACMSSSSSSDRVLYIAEGSKENVIDSMPAMGASIGKMDFDYVGGPTTIYFYSPSSGVNIYYIKTAPMMPKMVAYVTADITLDPSAATPADDPIIRMLKADSLFNVEVMVVANDATPDLSGYDIVVAQEGFGSSADIFKPGGSLGLENITVPFIYNKAYALRDGKAVTSATSATKEVAGQLYLEVPVASQSSDLFSGITFDGDSVMLFKSGATDAGIAGEKAFSYTIDLEMSDATTILGQPKGATENVSICFNDIPAGTVLGTQDTLKARMISISENYGAMCKDGGSNLTSEGLTIWRNALYMAAGVEVPTSLFVDVATLDTLYTSVGMLSPMFDAEEMAYQLNLPPGTSTVSLMAMPTSELASVTAPGAISLSDGMDKEASVIVISPLNTDTMTYMVYIHVQSENEILYVSNSNGIYGTAGPGAINIYDALADAGYSVTIVDKLALNNEGFDYSPYSGLVIGAGVGSSWVNNFAKDGYPIPCVTMQHDGPRKGKWGWVGTDKDNDIEMNVVKTATDTPVDSVKMEITNVDHYITDVYALGQLVEWNNGTGLSEDWSGQEVKSYNLGDSISTAIPLGRISVDGSALTSWRAVPSGSSVRSLTTDGYQRVTLANNVVYLGVFNGGLLYAEEAFDTILVRSLQWAMGEDVNAKLASLTPSMGELAPGFDPEKMEYQLNLPMGSTTVSLSAMAENPNATVTVPDALALSDGMTETMMVKVLSAGKKDSMMYKVMVHVQAEQEILYVSSSNGAYGDAKAYDTNVYDGLVEAGYSVTFAAKNAIFEWTPDGIVPFDYTPYRGIVLSGGAGSSNVNDYAKRNYPIPCVSMQNDGPKVDKWGWLSVKKDDNNQMNITKSYDESSAQMVITNADHMITEVYNVGDTIKWTTGTATDEDFLGKEIKSYNLLDSVPAAIPLATIPADGSSLTTMWAVPAGTTLRSMNGDYSNYEKVTTSSNVVLMYLFNDGLLYAGADFDSLLVRALEWAMIEDKNAKLTSLTPSMGELAPDFDPEKMEYQLNLPMGSTTISLSAMAENPNATVTVPGALALSDGMTETMMVKVVSAGKGDSMMYNVMVHVQTDEEILYVSSSNGAYGDAKAYDTNVYDALVADGYSVTFAAKNAIFEWTPDGIVPFDYTPYIGMVLSGGAGSSNVNDYAKRNYPIPCVSMQNDGPKANKWGWTGVTKDDDNQMNITKSYDETTAQMVVTNNSHYITENYNIDDVLTWTIGTAADDDWSNNEVKSYNLTDSIAEAVPLATIPADGSSLTTMWAIPEGSSVRSMNGTYDNYERVTTTSRVVLMYLFNDGLLYAGDDFGPVLVRSLEWVLGAGPPTSAVDVAFNNEIVLYPNPAKDYAKIRFDLRDMQEVSLSLYNMVGQKIEISSPELLTSGMHEIEISTQKLNEGIYVYVLKVGSEYFNGKLSVVK